MSCWWGTSPLPPTQLGNALAPFYPLLKQPPHAWEISKFPEIYSKNSDFPRGPEATFPCYVRYELQPTLRRSQGKGVGFDC